ncbi:MAG: ATP-binding protein [Clostridium sp.]|nr:ATP-binding protein [Clostridium sp.]
MERQKKLPIGIENFEKIRKEGFYYVDKTSLIIELLNNWSEVNLFTRPRRFGKSLNMSMLKAFFEYGADRFLFDGLEIAGEKGLCERYMGRFPVISISLKDVEAANFETARRMLCSIVGNEALRFQFLLESSQLSDLDKEQYRQLIRTGEKGEFGFSMAYEVLANSLLVLSGLLNKHYNQKVILLIDEYDVPLDKAQHSGYYDEMVDIMRKLFSRVLKGNDNLYFAVLTGCLKVAKESIFTGLNNIHVLSITSVQYDEHFGFSGSEVRQMLEFYGFSDKYDLVREWYDGYRFGNADIYCPWDVINYVNLMRSEPGETPKAFWINTSGNDILRKFFKMANQKTRREIERLIDGEYVAKKINQELTWRDLYENIDNLWSVLFTTGYLTQRGKVDEDVYRLAIPNLEIKKIFVEQILEWFQLNARKDAPRLDAFCNAFAKADAGTVERMFNEYLQKIISIRDTSVRRAKKENFYHGILLGLLSHRESWDIDSNAESGDGFSDILVEIEEGKIGIVIEVKYADKDNLETECAEALIQIEKRRYETKLKQDGMNTIIKYGIACRKKECKVRVETC